MQLARHVAGDHCGRIFVLDQRGKLPWSADSGVTISSFGEDSRPELPTSCLGREPREQPVVRPGPGKAGAYVVLVP